MAKLEEEFEVDMSTDQIVAEEEEVSTPEYGSDEWNDYVMSLFHSDEMIDGNPLCHGLRRVARMLLGDIVVSRPVNVFPSMDADGPGRSTVVYEVVFDWMNTGEHRTFGDVAETWHGNTDDLFLAHATATACTKAESRVLRKALLVRCLAAEELAKNKNIEEIVSKLVRGNNTTGEMADKDPASEAQINFLAGKCRQLGINVCKYVSANSEVQKPRELSKQVASKLIQKLNTYQTNDNSIPEDILGFDPNWE